ncbi:PD-(D/E)XK nuclease superfamily protein [Ralstonia phage RpY1]|nr:PD-(D/E)XK nuclease superfamily protein [Ralstonia phage RpY1]
MENELLVEQRFHLHELHSDLFGTSDAIVWQPHLERLSVIDLKYGAGVPVEVEDNPQLQYYALGALLANKQWKPREVEVVIVQPRCPHPDGPVRTQVLQVVDLLDFAADLVEAVKRTEEASAAYLCADSGPLEAQWQRMYLEPGDHCRFCPAAAICPAQKNKAQQLAKQAFAPGLPYDAKQLAETLEWLPVLEAWIKNTREFAYAEAEKGHDIPRHKLVEKRATRKWREENAAILWLRENYDPDDDGFTERKLMSPAAIEKLLPKEKRAALDDLCIKESSGHTLVHESDKREAIKVDAKSAFANT